MRICRRLNDVLINHDGLFDDISTFPASGKTGRNRCTTGRCCLSGSCRLCDGRSGRDRLRFYQQATFSYTAEAVAGRYIIRTDCCCPKQHQDSKRRWEVTFHCDCRLSTEWLSLCFHLSYYIAMTWSSSSIHEPIGSSVTSGFFYINLT